MKTRKSFEHATRDSRFVRKSALALAIACGIAIAGSHSTAYAGVNEQADRMYNRLIGTPPTDAKRTAMATQISNGDALGAAMSAMDVNDPNSAAFYRSTLKNLAMPWTNRDSNVFAPLNDYVATFIGMVRDDVAFNTALSDDILYIGNSSSGAPAYSSANNDHYQFLDDKNADLRVVLTRTTQSATAGTPATATAGLITTRAAAAAFFIAGTNRAMFRFTMMNHLCHDMEQVQQTGYPPDMIRQDVSRSPGGDSRIFLNSCIGCHSGMDPMARAFAYYNFNDTTGRMEYTPGQVQPKYFINSDNFKPGFVTPDDHWENRWRAGPNSNLGWSSAYPGSGSGAKSLGQELANSDAFAQCQVEKVFKTICFRAPSDAQDRQKVSDIVGIFKSNNYSLKRVFAETAVYCMGQ